MAPWENIFKKVSIDNFKIMGNKILKSFESSATQPIALLNPVTTLTNVKEKEGILSTLQDDPV